MYTGSYYPNIFIKYERFMRKLILFFCLVNSSLALAGIKCKPREEIGHNCDYANIVFNPEMRRNPKLSFKRQTTLCKAPTTGKIGMNLQILMAGKSTRP